MLLNPESVDLFDLIAAQIQNLQFNQTIEVPLGDFLHRAIVRRIKFQTCKSFSGKNSILLRLESIRQSIEIMQEIKNFYPHFS